MNIDQTVAAAIAALNLGEHISFDALTQAIEHQRGRRIQVSELKELGEYDGLCALLFYAQDRDLILHAHSDSQLHTQQFILHEFAHIILGHCDDDGTSHDLSALDGLLPDIPASVRSRALARSDLTSEQEIAAESLADILAARIRGSAFADTSYTEIFG
ncbi:hypothetical protein [Microbacterium sp. YY-01]|uniref:hypothetical protein n=1 Tax=Microbacterium sp. YY-01 TaxID=3421634 RepID=UPI003D178EE3